MKHKALLIFTDLSREVNSSNTLLRKLLHILTLITLMQRRQEYGYASIVALKYDMNTTWWEERSSVSQNSSLDLREALKRRKDDENARKQSKK